MITSKTQISTTGALKNQRTNRTTMLKWRMKQTRQRMLLIVMILVMDPIKTSKISFIALLSRQVTFHSVSSAFSPSLRIISISFCDMTTTFCLSRGCKLYARLTSKGSRLNMRTCLLLLATCAVDSLDLTRSCRSLSKKLSRQSTRSQNLLKRVPSGS